MRAIAAAAVTLLLVIIFNFSDSSLTRVCKVFEKNAKHEFHPLRRCQRSNKTVIAFTDVEDVEQCAAFARHSKALAFNFSPKSRRDSNLFVNETKKEEESDFYSCECLACPEYQNYSTVINDTRFDYYSLYTYPAPFENATCIESLGMFLFFSEKKNYTAAAATCKTINGQLAHITTERRTNELSKLLQNSVQSSNDSVEAFVGLNETTRGKFITSNAEPLECFDYRAFSQGHPSVIRKQPSCVVITQRSSWKVVSCTKKFNFICELFTSGPNPCVNNLKESVL
ncbi:hypothetical protein PVAND_005719 [Polypedilum vanderplanki]|uniref:C-type lectin domain-containing protein n=1 Tax=Polypedilum vanderplanki TaxID=319348 RepID=A0A9J6C0X5_POLVA|nr:hypothetical protein PVAND_005719 [Polypedilum vanderplanki]